MRGRVLVVDDDRSMCEAVAAGLSQRGFDVAWRTGGDEALHAIEQETFGAVVTDVRMRGMSGLQLCERIKANRPDIPVVVVTAFGSLDTAVAAIRAGAYDFITKPLEIEALSIALDRAMERRRLQEEVKQLRRLIDASKQFEDVVGASPVMLKLYDLLQRAAESDASILITGETGTGKELVARGIHRRSPRSSGPFVAINCAAMPEALLESELFGHVRGAFTDARVDRDGLFVQAEGGTVFLDEIGDMPLSLQPKILRAIDEHAVRPIGGSGEVRFDVRIIAATHRDLESAVEEGRFREDLYFRLNVIHIEIPPLRSRGSDVLLVAHHFIEQFAARSGRPVTGLTASAAEKLLGYSWPGNIRELRNCIERAVALTTTEKITVDDLADRVRGYVPSHVIVASDDPEELVPLEVVERRYIERVLEATSWNKALAARILGLDRKTLQRRIERYQAQKPQ